MLFDYTALDSLRIHHPAWRLLRSEHAPLIASFLHRTFIAPNVRVVASADLAEALEDELYGLRQQLGEAAFPKSAAEYLNDWSAPDKGWLRKFYAGDSDEPQFDLTPPTERAIAWLAQLSERNFIGTESRLLTLFELLRQICEGSEADPAKRLTDLQRRRSEIDGEIARVKAGDVPLLDDTALKDRFQQFLQLARDLLTDFREVEHNFRLLDRRVRERIALWEGAKGELLEQIMGERDAIADSDQGRSFRGFWEFLMSSRRQAELSELLEHALALPAIADLHPDPRTRRVHYDWLEAGEHTQRTVAQLSQQLRRFLDDQAWLENRRIMEILHGIEAKALAVRDAPPAAAFIGIAQPIAAIELAMERPLHRTAHKTIIADIQLAVEDDGADTAGLFGHVVVDKGRLARHIRRVLHTRSQVTLRELIDVQPLENGLAELIAYLELGSESFAMSVDESAVDLVAWEIANHDGATRRRQARIPRIVFVRET
jgi:hypothetical protein